MTRKLYITYFFASVLALAPIIALGTQSTTSESYANIFDSFNKGGLIDAIKKINFPQTVDEGKDTLKSLPLGDDSLENTIKDKTSDFDLEKVNRDVDDETGIDFIKFFRWLKKIFLALVGIVKELLSWIERLS